MQGWWKEHQGQPFDVSTLPPEFQKPNHPVFSDQSRYHGVEGFVGGRWGRTGSAMTFVPGETNVYSPKALQGHFDIAEPESALKDTRKSPIAEAHPIDAELRRSLHLGSRGWPGDVDVTLARMHGFGYGTGRESFINRQVARVGPDGATIDPSMGPPPGWKVDAGQPRPSAVFSGKSKNVDLSDPANAQLREKLGHVYAQASLAADRVPLAALGFDPTRLTIDSNITREQIHRQGVSGQFSMRTKQMYAALGDETPVIIVHESIHHGLDQLRKEGGPRVQAALKTLGMETYNKNEEFAVTYMMARLTGDPEYNREAYSRADTMAMFRGEKGAAKRRALDIINDAAADLIAQRRPRGPA